MIYEWQQEAWQILAENADRLPNAWLLFGQRGTGKLAFARHLAHALLCEQPRPHLGACGQCPSCHLNSQNTHPDLYELTPAADDADDAKRLQQIKIEAVREVIADTHLTPLRAPRRVVLIHPAESMNLQAANALLKVLEEPSDSVIFILVSHSRDKLLPTIKSRCRQFALPVPSYEQAVAYLRAQKIPQAEQVLAFHGGSPLFEEDLQGDALRDELFPILIAPRLLTILDYAAQFDRCRRPLSLFIDWFGKWLTDIVAVSQSARPVFYPAHKKTLRELAEKMEPLPLFALYDRVIAISPYGQHTLNVKLAVEDLLLDYLKLIL